MTLVVYDLEVTEANIPHQIPAIHDKGKADASVAFLRSYPVYWLLAGANHTIQVINIDELNLSASSKEPVEMFEIHRPVFGPSDISNKKVIPDLALGVRLDGTILD